MWTVYRLDMYRNKTSQALGNTWLATCAKAEDLVTPENAMTEIERDGMDETPEKAGTETPERATVIETETGETAATAATAEIATDVMAVTAGTAATVTPAATAGTAGMAVHGIAGTSGMPDNPGVVEMVEMGGMGSETRGLSETELGDEQLHHPEVVQCLADVFLQFVQRHSHAMLPPMTEENMGIRAHPKLYPYIYIQTQTDRHTHTHTHTS